MTVLRLQNIFLHSHFFCRNRVEEFFSFANSSRKSVKFSFKIKSQTNLNFQPQKEKYFNRIKAIYFILNNVFKLVDFNQSTKVSYLKSIQISFILNLFLSRFKSTLFSLFINLKCALLPFIGKADMRQKQLYLNHTISLSYGQHKTCVLLSLTCYCLKWH